MTPPNHVWTHTQPGGYTHKSRFSDQNDFLRNSYWWWTDCLGTGATRKTNLTFCVESETEVKSNNQTSFQLTSLPMHKAIHIGEQLACFLAERIVAKHQSHYVSQWVLVAAIETDQIDPIKMAKDAAQDLTPRRHLDISSVTMLMMPLKMMWSRVAQAHGTFRLVLAFLAYLQTCTVMVVRVTKTRLKESLGIWFCHARWNAFRSGS